VEISFSIGFTVNISGVRAAVLYKNGDPLGAMGKPISNYIPANSDSVTTAAVPSITLDCIPGDYFEVWVIQTSGAALNVVDTGTNFSIKKLR